MIQKVIIIFIIILPISHVKTQEALHKWVGVYGPKADLKTVQQLKKSGVNTVFLKAHINAVKFFKKHGFNTLVSFPVFFDSRMLDAHPELHAIDKNGNRLPRMGWYRGINPAVEWYRKLQLRKIQYIIRQFPADGLFLDFIRFPVHWENKNPTLIDSSFSAEALKAFEQFAGITIPANLKTVSAQSRWIYEKHLSRWIDFKCSIITQFINTVKKSILEIKPSLKLGIFMIPWKNDDYNGAIKSIAGQNIDNVKNIVDYISPMVYHKSLGNNENWLADILQYFKNKAGEKVFPIIQSFGVKEGEFLNALRVVNTYPGIKGFTVFSYQYLNHPKWEIMYRYLSPR